MSTQQLKEIRSLYEITGSIADANTMLVNRAELRRLYTENLLLHERHAGDNKILQDIQTQRDELRGPTAELVMVGTNGDYACRVITTK